MFSLACLPSHMEGGQGEGSEVQGSLSVYWGG